MLSLSKEREKNEVPNFTKKRGSDHTGLLKKLSHVRSHWFSEADSLRKLSPGITMAVSNIYYFCLFVVKMPELSV